MLEDTDDPTLDGIVISQDPVGGTQAKPNSLVTLFVGRFVEPTTTTTHAVSRARPRRRRSRAAARASTTISLASARSVIEALDPERYETLVIEIGRDGRWELARRTRAASDAREPQSPRRDAARARRRSRPRPPSARSTSCFPILHGPFGEDGTVQGLLELAGVPYVGAGVAASALCMDKDLFKAVLRDRGIPVARNVTLRDGRPDRAPVRYPVFVKPARLGSSVGISKVHDEASSRPRSRSRAATTTRCSIEEFVDGRRGRVRRARQPRSGRVASSARSSRTPSGTTTRRSTTRAGWSSSIPPGSPPRSTSACATLAVESFVATECEGMARIDFFVRRGGEVVVNEINTIPGFTATSVYAKLFEASGIPYAELLDRLIELALERHERRRALEF